MDSSKCYVKAVILLSLNDLKIHLTSFLLGSSRISFIEGQKHLKSLLLLHDFFFFDEGRATFKPLIEKRHIRPQICTEEKVEGREVEVFLWFKHLLTGRRRHSMVR